MSNKILQQEWTNYSRNVISRHAGLIQLAESRRAFYAGAHAVLLRLSNLLEAGTNPAAGADRDLVFNIKAELREFATNLEGGQA